MTVLARTCFRVSIRHAMTCPGRPDPPIGQAYWMAFGWASKGRTGGLAQTSIP